MMKKIMTSLKFYLFTISLYLLSFSFALAEEKRQCPSLDIYVKDGQGDRCLLCSIYEVVMEACASVVSGSWNAFAVPLQGVVAVAASIYIAVYTLKNIGNFSQQDPSAYLSNEKTGIIPLCVKVAAVIWLLGNQSFIYGNIICPVIATGMAIGQQVTGGGLSASFSGADVSGLFSAVIDNVRTFNDEIYKVVAMGRLLMCLAFLPKDVIDWHFHLIPFGAVLYVFGWFILIGAGFYLLDVLFRLAVGCMLLPMAIACGVSKLTSIYTKKTWNLFVNVFFNFVMLGMILEFIMSMVMESLTGNAEVQALLTKSSTLTDSDAKNIAEKIEVGSFILTTICCMVSFKLFMGIETITDKVSSSTSVGKLGQKTGATAAQMVQKPAGKLAKEGVKFADTARLEAGRKVSESPVGMKARKAGRSIKAGIKKFVGLQ